MNFAALNTCPQVFEILYQRLILVAFFWNVLLLMICVMVSHSLILTSYSPQDEASYWPASYGRP